MVTELLHFHLSFLFLSKPNCCLPTFHGLSPSGVESCLLVVNVHNYLILFRLFSSTPFFLWFFLLTQCAFFGFSSFYALIFSAEIKLNVLWRVGTGENGKEVDVQKNRNRREIETIYQTVQQIPSNPKEPWDLEMDYDDTLTPEIPIEQPPDADVAETQVSHTEHVNTVVASAPSLPQVGGGSATEPDLELLAVLLKNPELVFALTSGQAGNLSSEETVKLLDMIKTGGAGLAGSLNGLGGKVEEKVEVSLPSPTPSSNNPGTVRDIGQYCKFCYVSLNCCQLPMGRAICSLAI
jgi:hypothetical protein